MLVDFALRGNKCSVFVYGVTGSGKTFTLTGGEWKRVGVVQQTIMYAWLRANAFPPLKNFRVHCTMVQLYKSLMVDLLRTEEDPFLALDLVYNNDILTIKNAIQFEQRDFLLAGGD